MIFRPASEHDLEALNDVYNEYVKDTHFTFDVEPMTMEKRREWFTHYGRSGRHRVLVAVRDETVVGYTTSSRFRPKPAYETSVETSIYLAADAVGRGVGTKLYGELFKALETEDVHREIRRRLPFTSVSGSRGSRTSRSRGASSAAIGTWPGAKNR